MTTDSSLTNSFHVVLDIATILSILAF